ncbi:hypothetical protein FQR65_LT05821 [Abscondita terminalis]|nr:hypothetical protein FQR65_LT05821 [Abscondita terminalis]
MAPTLYMINISPAVRAVLITAKAIELKLDEYNVDMLNGEHLSEKYLKMNPLHTVPTLDDNGKAMYDSHVITPYIVDKYGKNDVLYPKDLYERALVNQGLAFDLGSLYTILRDIDIAYFKKEITCLTSKMVETVKTLYGFLETMIERNGWVSLDRITLADISCYTTVTSLDYHVPIKPETYPNISKWIKRCAELSYFENDPKDLEGFNGLMKTLNAKRYEG